MLVSRAFFFHFEPLVDTHAHTHARTHTRTVSDAPAGWCPDSAAGLPASQTKGRVIVPRRQSSVALSPHGPWVWVWPPHTPRPRLRSPSAWCVGGAGGPSGGPGTQPRWPQQAPEKPRVLGLKIIPFNSPLETEKGDPKRGRK